jgi:hypothetical protein
VKCQPVRRARPHARQLGELGDEVFDGGSRH